MAMSYALMFASGIVVGVGLTVVSALLLIEDFDTVFSRLHD